MLNQSPFSKQRFFETCMSVPYGTRIFVCGVSGVGKTTLINEYMKNATVNVFHIRAGGWIAEKYPDINDRNELTRLGIIERKNNPTIAIEWIKSNIKEAEETLPVVIDGIRCVEDFAALYRPGDACFWLNRIDNKPLNHWEEMNLEKLYAYWKIYHISHNMVLLCI